MASSVTGVGPLLREWRAARRLSQLALADAAEVSTRHLSCVETGRARPSAELVLHLAAHLEVPLRARNQLLLAAGYAPVYPDLTLEDPAMAPVARTLEVILQRSEPNPAMVVDQRWNLLRANAPALWLCTGVAPRLLEPPANVVRLSTDPDGLRARIVNFEEYAEHLRERVRASAVATRNPDLVAMAEHLDRLPRTPSSAPSPGPSFAIPLLLDHDGQRVSLFSTIATFGTATDVGLSEMSIETFYPADDATADLLAARPWA